MFAGHTQPVLIFYATHGKNVVLKITVFTTHTIRIITYVNG